MKADLMQEMTTKNFCKTVIALVRKKSVMNCVQLSLRCIECWSICYPGLMYIPPTKIIGRGKDRISRGQRQKLLQQQYSGNIKPTAYIARRWKFHIFCNPANLHALHSTALGSRCYLLIMRIWREMPADDELDDNESYCFDYDVSIEYNQMINMLTIIMIKNRERYLR